MPGLRLIKMSPLVLSLLWLSVVAFELSPEMQQMVEAQKAKMARIEQFKNEALKDEYGMVTPHEYGRLLKRVLMESGSGRPSPHFEEMINQYVKTLPHVIDPDNVLMDIGMGDFSKLMMDHMRKQMERGMEEKDYL